MLNRFVSLFLCAAMLCSPWPVSGNVYAGVPPVSVTGLSDWSQSSFVPAHLGAIESHFETDSSQGVILIEDAHDVPEAQKRIGQLLHYFEKYRNVERIALEGAEGQLDTFFLQSFPDTKKLHEQVTRLMRKGELSGGVWAALLANPVAALKYIGLEEGALYRKTLAF